MTQTSNIQLLLDLYQSGRYQCDIQFYKKLLQLVQQLQMYEFVPDLQKNFNQVQKIHQMVTENSDSLDDNFDEDKAIEKAAEIKNELLKLNSNQIKTIVTHCQKLKFTSYSHHAAKLIAKCNYHSKYQEVMNKIVNSIHDPQLKIDHVMIFTLFMLRNTEKIQQILSVYEKSIQNCIALMKQFRKNRENVKKLRVIFKDKKNELLKNKQKEQAENSVDRINELQCNLQNYCYGTYFIYATSIKLCDLVKIMQGKNNFILKLNSYKGDVEQMVEIWNEYDEQYSNQKNKLNSLKQIEKHMEYMPIKEIKQLFIGQKQGIQKINRTCKICLRYIQKQQQGKSPSVQYHQVCQSVVKQLLGRKG